MIVELGLCLLWLNASLFQSLSHDIVLGFEWLRNCNPHIDWWACTLSVKVPGGHHHLAALLYNSIAHVELASLDSMCNEVACGTVVWFTLIHPVEPHDAMGACGTLAGGASRDVTAVNTTRVQN